MDKAEVDKQKYNNVQVGSLDIPNETFLVECLSLESSSNVNSSIILHSVDGVKRQPETKRENFALVVTGTARYMSLAGKKTSKELHPTLMHVTCIAYLLYNCAMRVRGFFKNIDDAEITIIKAATIKNKDRKNDVYEAGLPSRPVLVTVRWVT